MKLIIQIPCFNEEGSIPVVLAALPRNVEGFNIVEWLIIDDGSTDRTIEVSRVNGVDHIVRLPKHQGLSKGFMAGLEACLKLGADVIVNIDADNQYCTEDIPNLTNPILAGTAQIVIGARPINEIKHFSAAKKFFQHFGSWVVRQVSKTQIPDVTSGFRALSRQAAMQLNVFSDYTYTLETIIQAGQKEMSIMSVPIRVNEDLRPSRLLKGTLSYIKFSIFTIIRIVVVYKPFRFFFMIGSTLFGLGLVSGFRFLYYFAEGEGKGHVQSLVLVSILLGIGFQTILVAFLADLLAVNRRLLEDIQYKSRRMDLKENIEDNSDNH